MLICAMFDIFSSIFCSTTTSFSPVLPTTLSSLFDSSTFFDFCDPEHVLSKLALESRRATLVSILVFSATKLMNFLSALFTFSVCTSPQFVAQFARLSWPGSHNPRKASVFHKNLQSSGHTQQSSVWSRIDRPMNHICHTGSICHPPLRSVATEFAVSGISWGFVISSFCGLSSPYGFEYLMALDM